MGLWKRLELEWKIFLLALLVLVASGLPLQKVFEVRLREVLDQSIDPGLDSLLRSHFEKAGPGEEREAIVASLERSRQWRALLPSIVREQRRGIFVFSVALLGGIALVSFWTLKRLTKPLRNLAEAVDEIGKGRRAAVRLTSGGALGKVERAVGELQEELGVLREEARMQGMHHAWQDISRVMAHEIKNPLTPIRLTLDRLEEKISRGEQVPPDVLGKSLDRINSQLDVLERLVNQFRSFSREPEVRLAKVALHRSVAAVAGDMAQKVRTGITGAAMVAADPYLLNQVLLNIWKNSLEAGADRIDASITVNGREAAIAISDNGCGIPKAELERVWLPYVSSKKGGTGLGLPIVKKIVESMGGRVSLTSATDGPGRGVTVVMNLHVREEGDTVA